MLNRRDVLNLAASASAASVLLARAEARPTADEPDRLRIVDTNVSLFEWPFRRLPLDDVTELVSKFRSLGISQARAGSFDGILHRDITAVNERLFETCRNLPELIPIGSINPTLPDCKEELRRCKQRHRMPGIRLHPNYHGYDLHSSDFADLLNGAD